jgi:hypothetical protein
MAQRVLTKHFSFNGGEWSGEALARGDLERYGSSVKTMLNWLPRRLGGANRFPGTDYIGDVGGASRMEGIEFSADDKYLFVFRANIIDIYQNDVIYQSLVTPWAEDDLFELDYSHALDTIVVVHGDYSPRRIYRDSSNVFFIEDLMDETNEIHITSIPLSLGNVFEYRPITFYAQDWHMVPTTEMPEADYVYEVTRHGTTGNDTSPTFTKTVGDTTTYASDATGAKFTNRGLRALYYVWNPADGYPRTVTFVENRLVFGGTPTYPNRYWLSRSGDFFNFSLGSGAPGDAIDDEILSDTHEKIEWLFGGRNLVIGTSAGEWANIQTEPITPTTFYLRKQTGIGSARRSPVEIDGSVIHITRERNEIQALLYARAENAYIHDPISLLNPDAITAATQLAVTTSRSADDANLLWALNDEGVVAVLNTLRSQDVLGWCRRSFDDTVEGVATLGDDVYFIAGNDYGVGVYEDGVYESGVYAEDGVGSRALLKLSTSNTDYSATSTESPASVTHSGFTYLAGATVQVVADGAYVGTKTVSSGGVITLDDAAEVVVAGLAIPVPTMETLPPAFDGPRGNISHLKKRIIRALVEVHKTQALTVDGQVQNFRLAQSPVDAPPPALTGIKEVRMAGWDRQPTVTITAPDPMNATVLSMTVEVAI